jgi:hypothetical protein
MCSLYAFVTRHISLWMDIPEDRKQRGGLIVLRTYVEKGQALAAALNCTLQSELHFINKF